MSRLGIRREDKNRWERRAPLTPDHVAELVEVHGLDFVVQPSARRIFADRDYGSAGASLDTDLSACRVVLGVKEIPVELLQPNQAYVYFSHTTKGQAYNVPALRQLLALGCTLIDVEHIVDRRGRRLVFFGRHAGHAGMIDSLWALGQRLLSEGHETPLGDIRLAHEYSSLDEASNHIWRIGERLRHAGLPDELRPIVCGITGSGNVIRGALEIFDRLPQIELQMEELGGLHADHRRPRNVIYRVMIPREARYERVDGGALDLAELAEHPERYRGALVRYLPSLTMLIHGAFWEPTQPHLLTLEQLRRHWQSGRPRLRVIGDISCDVRGGIEATVKVTTPGAPVFVYDLDRDADVDGVHGRGPVILAIDNLPCQLAAEASQHFGDMLVRFVPSLASCDWSVPLDELDLPAELAAAVVTHRGQLTPNFRHLAAGLDPA